MSDRESDDHHSAAGHHSEEADESYVQYIAADRRGDRGTADFCLHSAEHHRDLAIYHATMAVAEELRSARRRRTL